MGTKNAIKDELKKKYHKAEEVTDLKHLLYRSSSIYKDRTAFKLKNEKGEIIKVTYNQFKNDIECLGTSLIEKGFLNKPIAVIGKNSYSWCVSYLAATIVGIVVPIDKEVHTDDIINFMNVSESVCVLGDDKNLTEVIKNNDKLTNKETLFINFDQKEDNSTMLSFEIIKNSGKKLLDEGNKKFEEIKINPDEMKILLFTSGTTGNAKGVCLSQKNICSNILSTYGIVKVKRSDLFFSVLPLHHTYECTLGFLLAIYSGASIAHCEGLRHISKNMQEYHPSVILCVPLLLENVHKKIVKSLNTSLPEKYKRSKCSEDSAKLVTEDSQGESSHNRNENNENPYEKLPFFMKPIVKTKIKNTLGGRLRLFIVGAAAANPVVVDDFEKFGLLTLQGYGLTECAPLVAGNNDFYHKADSPGLPIPNVEYKIHEPNDEGVGEIIVKGPNVMLGYYNNPEETKKAIKDGWFYTGDLGKIDDDGYLYITGRCKSVIVTKNGKNIYPEEVEYYLNDDPLISEALVLGISKENDDETYINAQIYPDIEAMTEYFKGTVPTKEEIKKLVSDVISSVNKKLPNYKHIKSFVIRDKEFEKTTTQKIKRYGDNVNVDKK